MTATDFLNSNKNLSYTDFFKGFVTETVNGTLSGMNGFLTQVNSYYVDKSDLTKDTSYLNAQKDDQFYDLKKETYYNVKSIYDKVSGSAPAMSSTPQYVVSSVQDLTKLENIDISDIDLFYNLRVSQDDCVGETKSTFDLYQIFQVVDRGNNDISTKVLADLTYLYNNLYSEFVNQSDESNKNVSKLTSSSIYSLISGLARQNGFLFQQIPSYLNLNSAVSNTGTDEQVYEVVDHLFGTHTNTDIFGDFSTVSTKNKNQTFTGGLSGFPGYILQLGSVESVLNHDTDNRKLKNNWLNSFCLDVVKDVNGQKTVTTDGLPTDIKNSNVTCFTVDFGKQNQQMFSTIDIDTSQYNWTEQSINSWVDIVNNTKGAPQTTNLFPIFEKMAFFCTVSGLGNATIQPLTYFYLRNVPLFNGTYWITNVSHKISPNNMLTTFKGCRQPIVGKNDVRLELLNIYKRVSKNLQDISEQVNSVVVEGLQDTAGVIRKLNSSKAFPDFIQKNGSGVGFSTFEGKTILGCHIYSITNNNGKTGVNLSIIAALYNQAKWLIHGSDDHNKILSAMVDVAVGNMSINALRGGKRYNDGDNALSLSKLFKESGKGYNLQGDLSTALDNISKSKKDFIDQMVLSKGEKLYGVKESTGQMKKSATDVSFTTVGSELNVPSNFDITSINLFIEDTAINQGDDTYPSLPNNFTLYDVFAKLGGTTFTITNIADDIKLVDPSGNSASVLYRGSYNTGSPIIFFQTTNDGVKSKSNYEQTVPPIIRYYVHNSATVDEQNQIVKQKVSQPGTLKSQYITNVKIMTVSEERGEYNKWHPGTYILKDSQCNDIVKGLLTSYWDAAKGTFNGICTTDWSAPFISYIVKKSGVKDFPYNTSSGFIVSEIRKNKTSSTGGSWYGYSASDNDADVNIGDIICYTRGKSLNTAWDKIDSTSEVHCDVVVSIDDNNNARTIGGSVNGSVADNYVKLDDNDRITTLTSTLQDATNIKYIGVLKYQPIESSSSGNVQYTTSKSAQAAYDNAEAQESGFKNKVRLVASKIGAQEMDLVQIMFKESAGTLDPGTTNDIGCVGLIQFCPDHSNGNIKTIGTSIYTMSALKSMNRIQQMDVVMAYFKSLGFNQGSPKNIGDLYCAVFYPAAIGKPTNFIIGSEKSDVNYKFKVGKQNPGIAKASNTTINGSPVCTVDGAIKFVTA